MAYYHAEFKQGMTFTMDQTQASTIHPIRAITSEQHLFNHYSDFVRQTAIFDGNVGVLYCALKLNGEAGEFAEKVEMLLDKGKLLDSSLRQLDPKDHNDLILELGDVSWYCVALIQQLGGDFLHLMTNDIGAGVAVYDTGIDVVRNTHRLNAATGRVAEKVGKFIRDRKIGHTNDAFMTDAAWRNGLYANIITVMEHVYALALSLDSQLVTVINTNIRKLESRRARNVLGGSGDHR